MKPECERVKTVRRCHECLARGKTNYVTRQLCEWKDDFGHKRYRFECPECHDSYYGHWGNDPDEERKEAV